MKLLDEPWLIGALLKLCWIICKTKLTWTVQIHKAGKKVPNMFLSIHCIDWESFGTYIFKTCENTNISNTSLSIFSLYLKWWEVITASKSSKPQKQRWSVADAFEKRMQSNIFHNLCSRDELFHLFSGLWNSCRMTSIDCNIYLNALYEDDPTSHTTSNPTTQKMKYC